MAGLRGAALAIVGGLLGSTAFGCLVTGCGGDDTGTSSDSGGDQTAEGGGPDVVTRPDATGDAIKNDVTAQDAKDGGGDVVTADADATVDAADASPDADATVDAGDTGVDGEAAVETDADGGANEDADAVSEADAGPTEDADAADADGEVADASDGDAADAPDGPVIPPGLVAYPGQYLSALCGAWAGCCGAGFDQTSCKSDFAAGGWDNTLPNSNVYSAGNLTFDSTQAAACVTALQNWPCGNWTAAANQAIITACSNVLGGTIAIGSTGCTDSFECVSGAYCNGGTCTALVASGGSCTRDYVCSYISTKQPALYCNLYPSDGGSPGTGTCDTPQADGTSSFCSNANAASDFACTNRLCGDNGTCASSASNPGTNACAIYGGG